MQTALTWLFKIGFDQKIISAFETLSAKTLEALREGMERYENGEIEEGICNETVNCDRCRQTKTGRGVKCTFCERNACDDCRRECAHCDKMFCLLCLVAK